MIFRAGRNEVRIIRSLPRDDTHDGRLMTTDKFPDAREISQVPYSHFVRRGRVQIARRTDRQRRYWRLASL